MKCDTCEREFQDGAVKVYRGKRVCPDCFRVLMAADVPDGDRQVQVVQTQQVKTTVCPLCNAEVHHKTRRCPYCGELVQRLDRALDEVGSVIAWTTVVLSAGAGSLLVWAGLIAPEGVSIVLLIFGGACLAYAAYGIWTLLVRH